MTTIKNEITGYAVLLLANAGFNHLSFERISSIMDISVTEIKKYFYDLDDLAMHILQEASRFCHEIIFPVVDKRAYAKSINSRKEMFVKFNNLIIRFFNDMPLGIAYVQIHKALKQDERFARMLETIKQDWINMIRRALYLIDNDYDAGAYFSQILGSAMSKTVSHIGEASVH